MCILNITFIFYSKKIFHNFEGEKIKKKKGFQKITQLYFLLFFFFICVFKLSVRKLRSKIYPALEIILVVFLFKIFKASLV